MQAARADLRLATAGDHRRVDALFAPLDLSRRGDYCVFLSAHLRAIGAIAAQVPAGHGLDLPGLMARLRGDLSALGAAPCAAEPPLACAPFAGHPLGVGYVLAGSHFGARVLLRQVARGRDPRMRAAQSYLAAPELAAAWRPVLAGLEALSPQARAEALRAARWSFSVFEAAGQGARALAGTALSA